jgi:hypothetical protein
VLISGFGGSLVSSAKTDSKLLEIKSLEEKSMEWILEVIA